MITVLLTAITLLTATSPPDALDSLLSAQQIRAGAAGAEIFQTLANLDQSGLRSEEAADLRFLAAYLPLADFASMTSADLIENVRLSRESSRRFTWGDQIDEPLYRHFILPHRISQEPFVRGWRKQFLEELTPRLKGLSMEEAALEVNHWCHERATFEPSSGRDQDPLTTIRAGLGRCEEEMILTIAALRAVGLPARQCYTPYWAHCDNNHAWTEVWVDGKWHHTGGCEPRPKLSDAWFSRSAGRAMLVVSSAFGDYQGDEPVLRRYGNSTLINSTPAYGDTREVTVTLLDLQGAPVPDAVVVFNLWNYGAFMPALGMKTDSLGQCRLDCGSGCWMVSAGKDSLSALAFNPADEAELTLQLGDPAALNSLVEVDYYPPPELPPLPAQPSTAADSLFNLRLQEERVHREKTFWGVWAKEAGIPLPGDVSWEPSVERLSELVTALTALDPADSSATLELMRDARGNWGTLYLFLTGFYPRIDSRPDVSDAEALSDEEIRARWLFVKTLDKKDRRDFSESVLYGSFHATALGDPMTRKATLDWLDQLDSLSKARYFEAVLAPRLDWEPSVDWRSDLQQFLSQHPDLVDSPDDKALTVWLKDSLVVDDKPNRLAPSLPPNWVLALRRGGQKDVERLYLGLCRARGIPARFNPVAGHAEFWREDQWRAVDLFTADQDDATEAETPAGSGRLFITAGDSTLASAPAPFNPMPESTESYYLVPADSALTKVLYLRDWAVSSWAGNAFSPVDFGYQEPFTKITWPQELPAGRYCLTTGFRAKDGSALVSLNWFTIEDGKDLNLQLRFRQPNSDLKP